MALSSGPWYLLMTLGALALSAASVTATRATDEDPSFAVGAANLGTLLQDISEDDLGLELLRGLFAQRRARASSGSQQKAQTVAARLESKIGHYSEMVRKSAAAVQELFPSVEDSTDRNHSVSTSLLPQCCDVRSSQLRLDSNFGTFVNDAMACQVSKEGILGETIAFHISQLMKGAAVSTQGKLKWQYFMSKSGGHLEYPATRSGGNSCSGKSDAAATARHRRRSTYFAAIHPAPRYIVILFDRGNSMSPEQIDVGRDIVQQVMSSMSDGDFIGFTAIADSAYFPLSPNCRLPTLSRATLASKIELAKFMNVVQASKAATDHAKGFQSVKELIRNSNVGEDATIEVMYISRGHLEMLTEKEGVFNALADLRSSVKQNIVINSFATVDGSKSQSTFELQYLEQVAAQNYAAHNLSIDVPVIPGKFVRVGLADDAAMDIGDLVQDSGSDSVQVLSPSWDAVGQGAVISLAMPVRSSNKSLLGVFGFDTHFSDLMEDVVFAVNEEDFFICVVRRYGNDLNVIFHPSLYASNDHKLAFVELGELENMDDVRNGILTQASGSRLFNRWSVSKESFANEYLLSWKWVAKSDLIVLVFAKVSTRTHETVATDVAVVDKQQLEIPPIYYQRQDSSVSKIKQQCRHFRSLATVQSGSLYLSPAAFSSSAAAAISSSSSSPRSNERTSSDSMHSYMAYLTDHTRLIANPGLREGLRDDVSLLSQLIFTWKNKTNHSTRQPFFVDRFAGTTSGVYVTYPGAKLPAQFDYAEQKWFTAALKFPGRVVLSGPKLHAKGAGHVVVLSQGLRERLPHESLPSSSAAAASVNAAAAGLDIPLPYLERLITDSSPDCLHSGVTCFLFDQDGTLIYHPVMTDPTYVGPIIDQHLNHKEPNVGKDLLLGNSNILKKTTCRSFTDGTTRRYYEFNADMAPGLVVSNTIQGNGCRSSYHITAVPGTNLFMGMSNSTCQSTTAVFCPCNINSKKCLMCPQSEEEEEATKKTCECPCECPTLASGTREDSCAKGRREADFLSHLPACGRRRAAEEYLLSAESDGGEDLQPCFPILCSAVASKDECSDLPGCAWCQVELEKDSELSAAPSFSPLTHPFCSELDKCFRGALGRSPRQDALGKMLRERSEATAPGGSDDGVSNSLSRSPVGPIIGGVLVFFLFMAFSAFCYRQRFGMAGVDGGSRCGGRAMLRGGNSGADNTLTGNIEIDDDDEIRDLGGGGHHNAIALENVVAAAAVISPYKMNPGYRRPPLTDSDHGYSTMTPMGGDLDSEIMPYNGPARERFRHRPPASLHNVTSGVSSRTTSPTPSTAQQQQHQQHIAVAAEERELLTDLRTSSSNMDLTNGPAQTVLSPNQFIVAATVHMVE